MSWVQNLPRKLFGLNPTDQEQIDKVTNWITDAPTMVGLFDPDGNGNEISGPGYARQPLDGPLHWSTLPLGITIASCRVFYPDGRTYNVGFDRTLPLQSPGIAVTVNLDGFPP